MSDCLFCKIIAGEIPSTKVYEDEWVYAFLDIDPQAPFHAVIVPKIHIASAAEINAENSHYVSKIFEAVARIAAQEKLEDGFRVVNNCGKDGGQTVGHIHFHLLARRYLQWPPG
ncbi:MAG: histidine triad nucleotide-binding protein [Clostridia bacterium]|nr:histidine triad nucleotide-binding protein [Clostridia bacterium]MBR4117255.1 histidine triad nucleotide-binding protein [Clostridia bacterium]